MNEKDLLYYDPRYTVRTATIADKQGVVSINATAEGSSDYLPALYDYYLRCWNIDAIVCEFDGKIIGFAFYSLIDGGETLVPRGGRLDVDHQEKGVAALVRTHYLKKLFKEKRILRVKGRASIAVVDKGRNKLTKKFQKHLFCESFIIYSTSNRASEILKCFQHGELPYPDFSRLIQLSATQTRSLLLSPDIYQKLFYGETVIINGVPYKCKAENILEVVDSENLTVFVNVPNRSENSSSVSFGCEIYVLSGNNVRYDIHIYAKDKDLIKAHLIAQIYSAAVTHKTYNIRFSVVVEPPVIRQSITDILHKFGVVEDTSWHAFNDMQLIGIMVPMSEVVKKYGKFLNMRLPSLL